MGQEEEATFAEALALAESMGEVKGRMAELEALSTLALTLPKGNAATALVAAYLGNGLRAHQKRLDAHQKRLGSASDSIRLRVAAMKPH